MNKLTAMPFVDLQAQQRIIKDDVDKRIQAVLRHGIYIQGPEIVEFEAALADFCDCKHVVGVSSGTDALLIHLLARGIGAGDAVFLPSFTFTATAEVCLLIGANPIFVDVNEYSFNIDPSDLEQKIFAVIADGNLTPRMIIAVDLFGQPADYDSLKEIAVRHGLDLLADAAQSIGGALRGQPVGSLATASATSFFPAKPLGCYGDGGALLTDDDELAACYRSVRAHGQGSEKYDVVRIGVNGRLDTLQAAVLLAKLQIFDDELLARDRAAAFYDRHLSSAVTRPRRLNGTRSAWAQYTIRLPDRDRVAEALKAQGIPTAIYYPRPMHLQTAFRDYGQGVGSLPVSEMLSGEVLSLPMHPYLNEETAGRVCEAVAAAMA